MNFNSPIKYSKNVLLIHLSEVEVEQIVEKKLLYFLNQKPLGLQILKTFYEPVEQVLIEIVLENEKSNQLQTAKILGINRNTLKKKIDYYGLDIKKILHKEKTSHYPQSEVFLSSVSSLDLLSVVRTKLLIEKMKNRLPKTDVIHQVCQPVELKIIQILLEFCNGNKIKASRYLGINRNTLKKKLGFCLSKVRAS